MISDNETDEFFNARLRGYQSLVPADMWDRIVEKKKRDRKLWLFFSRLLAVVILALGLTGSYFLFSQKKSAPAAVSETTKTNSNQTVPDTNNASKPNTFSGDDKMLSAEIKADDKIILQNNKSKIKNNQAAINYSGARKNNEVISMDKTHSPNGENKSEILSSSSDSNEIEKNKSENKNDSLVTKHVIKPVERDSSGMTNVKNPETKKNLPYRKWFLDLYGSADYPIISPPENWKSELSYAIGIKINRSLGKHFSVKTGIQFSQVNIGGRDSISGGKIQLMRWDLPVLVGYSVGNANLKTTFNAGAILNLNSWIHGNTIPDFFKTNTGLSLYLGVNFEKRINNKFSLFGEPYYRYQLTSMTVSSISSLKFIDVAGINIGARYYFKK